MAAPAHAEECRPTRYASLDITLDSAGRPTVPMRIGGKPVTMLVDTAGVYTSLTEVTVTTLALPRSNMKSEERIQAFGGTRLTEYTRAHDVELGKMKSDTLEFLIDPGDSGEYGGIIAPNWLRRYDIDLDFGNAKMNVLSKDHCPSVVYWTEDGYSRVPFTLNPAGQIVVQVELDGHSLDALVDTGAFGSVMSLETAERLFGFDDASPDLKLLDPEDKEKSWRRYPFKAMALEGLAISHPDILLVPNDVSKIMYDSGPKLIIGMGLLRRLHVYIAYQERALYVTPATAN